MRWRYTADGERAAIGYPDGTETTYSYDAGGFLAGKHHPVLGAVAFERDASGRLVSATGDGMRARWGYDDGDLAEYDFEATGRRRMAQLTRDPVGRVVATTVDGVSEQFSYDLAGQLLSAETAEGLFSFSYDANGRLACETSQAGTVEYEYDAAGQLLVRRGAASTEYEYDGAGRRVSETGDDFRRTWRWDELGRLVEIQSSHPEVRDGRTTSVSVDALGELAEVDGTRLLWDTADAFSPLTWMDQSAVIGNGSPWALASGGAAEWLVPDWQGTIGDGAHDPWGAMTTPGSEPGNGLRLGYRGELEFAGQTWLRNRAYEPASRSFLQPDPLPPVPGTACAANPYHYAANNPVGLSDPLGLRPISDAELQEHRDRMNRNVFEQVGHFVAEHKDYIIAGALVVGGGLLMATGVGGPVGMALIGAGVSAGMQKFTTGEVNWKQVAADGAIGLVTGGVGSGVATALGSSARLAATNPVVRQMVIRGGESVASGMADRGLHGDNPFDPRGLGTDLLTGGAPAVPGGRLGATTSATHGAAGAPLHRFTQEEGMLYRTGSQTDNALNDPAGVSFRDSVSSSADGAQVFRPGDKIWAVDSAKLPQGSVARDGGTLGRPDGHVSVNAAPGQIREAIVHDPLLEDLGLKSLPEHGSFRLPK
jgi:RHS repeat-associated protein